MNLSGASLAEALGALEGISNRSEYMRAGITALQKDLNTLEDPRNPEEFGNLLRVLYRAGRFDLALGRLFEGHVDALQIITRYGDAKIANDALRLARNGATFGVWNAPHPDTALVYKADRLRGGKSFASGAGILSHALVTASAGEDEKLFLLLVDLAETPPKIDRNWWRTTGMQASETHRVQWNGAPARKVRQIGEANAYESEPWFSGGALRFVAVQAGGLAAVHDEVVSILAERERTQNLHQARRIAKLFTLAKCAALIVSDTARDWFISDDPAKIAKTALARMTVFDNAEQGIAIARQAIGVSCAFNDNRLARLLADLSVYLCQPNPDGQREVVSRASVDGIMHCEL